MSSPLFYSHWGQGPAIVLLHGLFGSLENLGVVARQLQEYFSVYAIDLPNHGRSSHIKNISLQAMADKVIALMDSIGLEQAHFLGHSLGGKVSMELALRYPERVDHLIVADISPVVYARRHDDIFNAFRAVKLDSIKSRSDADKSMQAYIPDNSTRSFLLKNLEKSSTDVGVGNQWQWRIDLDGLEHGYESLIDGNTVDQPPFSNPVLFIKGEQSDYILPEHREQILSLFPKATVKVIHNTEHWLHVQKPGIFVGIVKRFLV